MAPMKLHGAPLSANVVRVAAVLNEMGLEFELVPVDFSTGAHKKPDFLALNPFGQVPALQDGDEVLFESRAINRYIATKYKSQGPDLLPTPSAKLEVWLEVESNQFFPAVRPLVFQLIFKAIIFGGTAGTADEAAVEKLTAKLGKVLDIYEAHLAAGNKYLAGDAYTLADANHLSYMFMLSKTSKAELITSRPHVKAWWDDISARPAWLKTAASIPLPPSPTA